MMKKKSDDENICFFVVLLNLERWLPRRVLMMYSMVQNDSSRLISNENFRFLFVVYLQ